jgi:hypothetical protein
MKFLKFQQPIATVILGVFLATQVLMLGTLFLVPPKKAEACFVVTCNIEIGNIYDIAKEVGLSAVRRVAIEYANKFLTRFVYKLQDKYKIRNFLYYDKVLTDYYLNRYIADRVTDPDLREIYNLLERGFISGAPTGTTGGPDPRAALIPRLNAAITKVYLDRGGVDPQKIYNPSSFATSREYFAAAQAYYSDPPLFTEQSLNSEFGEFQSSATSAAQLELLVGNGLKASRILGGTCSLPKTADGVPIVNGVPAGLGGVDPSKSPAGCQQSGGNWQPSALDQARSFIDNPTTYTAGWMDAAIKEITGINFDPNNYKSVLGSLLGSYLFNNLLLDTTDGVINEADNTYVPERAVVLDTVGVDIDGDGIIDGYDNDKDGMPDFCTYGGATKGTAGPPCKGSKLAMDEDGGAPPEGPDCTAVPTAQACTVPNNTGLVDQVKRYLVSTGQFPADATMENVQQCDSFKIVERVAWELRSYGAGMLATFHSSRCPSNGFSGDLLGFSDNSVVDILVGGLNPAWQPFPANGPPENGVFYVPARDPGDPSDACYKTNSCP